MEVRSSDAQAIKKRVRFYRNIRNYFTKCMAVITSFFLVMGTWPIHVQLGIVQLMQPFLIGGIGLIAVELMGDPQSHSFMITVLVIVLAIAIPVWHYWRENTSEKRRLQNTISPIGSNSPSKMDRKHTIIKNSKDVTPEDDGGLHLRSPRQQGRTDRSKQFLSTMGASVRRSFSKGIDGLRSLSSRREGDEMSDVSDMYTDITSIASDDLSVSSTSDSSSDSDSDSTSRISSVKSSALSGITLSTTSTEKERREEIVARQAARASRQATQLTSAELQAAIGDAYDSDSSDDSDSIDTDDISLDTEATGMTGMSNISGLTHLTSVTGVSAKSMASVRTARGNMITLNKKAPLPTISKKKTEEDVIDAMADNHELAQELSALGINTSTAHDLLANVDKMNPKAMMDKSELKRKKKEQQQKAKTQASITAAQNKKTLEVESMMAQEKTSAAVDASQYAAADIDAMLRDLEGDADENDVRMPTSVDLDMGALGLTAQEMEEMNIMLGKQHIDDTGDLVASKSEHKSSKRKDREEKERFEAMMREMNKI
jgi:hypothetical protein